MYDYDATMPMGTRVERLRAARARCEERGELGIRDASYRLASCMAGWGMIVPYGIVDVEVRSVRQYQDGDVACAFMAVIFGRKKDAASYGWRPELLLEKATSIGNADMFSDVQRGDILLNSVVWVDRVSVSVVDGLNVDSFVIDMREMVVEVCHGGHSGTAAARRIASHWRESSSGAGSAVFVEASCVSDSNDHG